MSFNNESYDLENASILRETEKAILVECDLASDLWIPKSQIHDDSEIWEVGEYGTLLVNQWWADKEGFNCL